MAPVARHCFVSGLVQGVAFRWYTREKASSLRIRGWVRNLPDGRVEAWIEGAPDDVEAMLAWLRRGPRAAQVRGMTVEEVEPDGREEFEIRSGRSAY